MPKVTISAIFDASAAQVWKTVTDLQDWHWRSDISRVQADSAGRTFVEYAPSGTATYFRITAFAPCRWYAYDMTNQKMSGRWEGFFTPLDDGGTMVEFSTILPGHNPVADLLLLARIRRRQQQYISDLRAALGEY